MYDTMAIIVCRVSIQDAGIDLSKAPNQPLWITFNPTGSVDRPAGARNRSIGTPAAGSRPISERVRTSDDGMSEMHGCIAIGVTRSVRVFFPITRPTPDTQHNNTGSQAI